MADVLSKSQLFVASCGGHLSSSSCESPAKRGTFCVLFPAVSSSSIRFRSLKSSSSADLFGKKMFVDRDDTFSRTTAKGGMTHLPAQMSLTFAKTMKWWEKSVQPNMKEISSAQDLVDSLQNTGDKLVIVDFFSPGCGGCRALHPKICQFAEANPDVMFLQVNYEEHKSMCYSLTVHVLPFFRFYRGSQGRLCSFSCTNATIKKFKDALAKHNTDRCSLGPTKGLEESELLALAANKDLNFAYTGKPEHGTVKPDELAVEPVAVKLDEPAVEPIPVTFPPPPSKQAKEEKSFVKAWR